MDYEKKYKEALDRAKKWHNAPNSDKIPTYANRVIEEIFPELKESEDESVIRDIRVVLESSATRFFKENGKMPVWYDRAVAWLEKQGEQKPVKWYREDEQNLNACLSYIPDVLLRRWLKDIIHTKYDKPIDKVEPKFKVGDWVVNKYGDSWHIDSFDKKNYQVSDGKGNYNYFSILHQDEMHFWGIEEDAKDGDVLASESWVFIYGGLDDMDSILYKFLINEDGEDLLPYKIGCNNTGIGDIRDNRDVHPATKEQRDLLFQRMKEEGYKWDENKKELIKL